MKKDFLNLSDFSALQLNKILLRALDLKKGGRPKQVLKGKTLGLLFEKSSTRTRVSFQVAAGRLGGQSLYLEQQSLQLARGETYADTAKVLSRYVDALVFRTFSQSTLLELARNATIPVINGLSDLSHPCQILADLMTVIEKKKNFQKQKIVYVGDGNNMANTWIEAAMILKFPLAIATPVGFEPDATLVKEAKKHSHILITNDPVRAVSGGTVINTDTWFSMGQEVSNEKRAAFGPFQVNKKLLAYADAKAMVLHCLPAHRGEEITAEVLDGPKSFVFDEAENRLWVQMAILEMIL